MIILLGIAGGLALVAAVLPKVLSRRPLSMPLVMLVAGVVLGLLPLPLPYSGTVADPTQHVDTVRRFTEIGLLLALAGAGLKVDRSVGLRAWSSTWRLLLFTLPLSVAAVAALGWWALGLAPAAALLLGAAASPTDPVLAGDVQVPSPGSSDELGYHNEIRFTLTTEAGLNDALAMPFVVVALALARTGEQASFTWGLTEILLPIVLGLAIGYACGKVLGWWMFNAPHDRVRLSEYSDGLVVLAIAFLPYAITEAVGGLGFLAVFVAAVAVRETERSHSYHQILHEFGEQLERLFVVIALLGLGLAMGSGLLNGLRPLEVGLALAVVLLVRPLLGSLGLIGAPTQRPATAAVAFFGVRGIGTLFYLAYGLTHAHFGGQATLWRVLTLVVAVSVVVHGLLSGPVMSVLERFGAHTPR